MFGPILLLTRLATVQSLALYTLGLTWLSAHNTRQQCSGRGTSAVGTLGVPTSLILLTRRNIHLFPIGRRRACLCQVSSLVHCIARPHQLTRVNDHAPIFLLPLLIAAVVLGAVQCLAEISIAGHLGLSLLLVLFLLSHFHCQPHTFAQLVVVEQLNSMLSLLHGLV